MITSFILKVERLSSKLRDYQLQVHDQDPDFHGLINLVDNLGEG